MAPATRSPRPEPPARRTTSRSSRTGASRRALGPTTCASTCTTCRRSRTGSPRRWAAPRGSSSARESVRSAGSSGTSPAGRTGSSGRITRASRSPRTRPARRSRSGSSRAATSRTSGGRPRRTWRRPPRRSARCSAGSRRASTGRPTTSSCTPPRCASRSTPPITGTGRSTPDCARSPASSSGSGLPVNPVSPEDAVEELLGRAEERSSSERGRSGLTHAVPARPRRHTKRRPVVISADERTLPIDRVS